MKIKDIVREYLEKNGYDGLFNSDGECGCALADLFPCGGDCLAGCEPGYKRKPKEGEDQSYDFVIAPERETPPEKGVDSAGATG